MKKSTKEKYTKLVEFLGEALGDRYEVVLHDIRKEGACVAAITNNHISNRDLDAPLTGFALEMLKNKSYLENDYLTGYKAITKKGVSVKGSTFFIKDGEELEGMLCINHDNLDFINVSEKILELGNIKVDKEDEEPKHKNKNEEPTEYLSGSLDDMIGEIVDIGSLGKDVVLKPEKKQQIIQELFEKGVFNVKGSVLRIAEFLNMSEQSVYRYLRKVDKSNK